ncbi:hypothetical protein [Wocania ichthyoenteri]|uniref:hypothetical protein n=1 Tax=Wocania ichthyoenteri TaxID=1230531 RepID=UPI00053D1DFF|nr:hypothetical protein [Wocania ichthyoenteri]
MKKYIILFTTLITISCYSQDKLTLGVTQDLRLGLAMDKKHGNPNVTPNMLFNWDWETKQFKSLYPVIRLQYEFANLSSGKLSRYSVHGGLTWNKVKTPKILFIPAYDFPNMEIGMFLGVGMLSRPNNVQVSPALIYSVTIEVSYTIFKGFRGVLKNELINRPDLYQMWNSNVKKINVSAGFEIDL